MCNNKVFWAFFKKRKQWIKQKASNRLQRQAEVSVGASADLVDKAQSIFDTAVTESLDTGNFTKISDASLNLTTQKKIHQSNIDTYQLIFEESPKLI